jgi:hypothetical protein
MKGLTTIELYLDKHLLVEINKIFKYHCHQLNPLSKITLYLVSEISGQLGQSSDSFQ